ncbi:MAG: class I tRNA ligase family protein, partial [Elusimicrobiota bacterium]
MELVNELYLYPAIGDRTSSEAFEHLIKMLFPFAPHTSEEIWKGMGKKGSLVQEKWSRYDPVLVLEENSEIVIQVNGRVRGKILVPRGNDSEGIKNIVLSDVKFKNYINGKIKKCIYVPEKILNIVMEQNGGT